MNKIDDLCIDSYSSVSIPSRIILWGEHYDNLLLTRGRVLQLGWDTDTLWRLKRGATEGLQGELL